MRQWWVCLGLLIFSTIVWSFSAQALSSLEFAWRLGVELAKKYPQKNFVVAPEALRLGFRMASLGARHKTQAQLLAFSEKAIEIARECSRNPKYAQDKIFFANRLWVDAQLPLEADLFAAFGSGGWAKPWRLDFTQGLDFIADRINDWTREETENLIKSEVVDTDLVAGTLGILTTAFAFQGNWLFPFEEAQLQESTFFNGAQKLPTRMMRYQGSFLAAGVGPYWAVDIPLANTELSVLFFLPKKGLPLSKSPFFVEGLKFSASFEWIQQLIQSLKVTPVSLSIPLFEWEGSFELAETLQALGLGDPFVAEKADFSGLIKGVPFHLHQLFHKTRVGFQPKGLYSLNQGKDYGLGEEVAEFTPKPTSLDRKLATEGAAPLIKPLHFEARWPFGFLLRHRSLNAVLLLGQVFEP